MNEQQKGQQPTLEVLKSMAINSAMFEILQENKEELLRRARMKLKGMGVDVQGDEFNSDAEKPQG